MTHASSELNILVLKCSFTDSNHSRSIRNLMFSYFPLCIHTKLNPGSLQQNVEGRGALMIHNPCNCCNFDDTMMQLNGWSHVIPIYLILMSPLELWSLHSTNHNALVFFQVQASTQLVSLGPSFVHSQVYPCSIGPIYGNATTVPGPVFQPFQRQPYAVSEGRSREDERSAVHRASNAQSF